MAIISPTGFLFSTTGGSKEIDLGTLSLAVSRIGKALGGEGDPFTASDIRRTVASLGISKEIRAQVLSHGRQTGGQAKHYDKYSYLPEKAAALAKWEAHFEEVISGSAGKVIRGRFRSSGT